MVDTFLMVKEISVNLEHSWRAETRYPSVMGLLGLLRILWRATFQPSFEKRSALMRERKRVRDFNRRDRSLDLRAVAQFRRLTPTTAPPQQLVGGATDGGYLVPEIGLAGLSLFSPGVGHVVDFEYNFAERGHKVFLADATVFEPPRPHDNFFFERKNLGSGKNEILLGPWIDSHSGPDELVAVQMDIEGAEWEALTPYSVSDETLARVAWMVVEFHGTQNFWSESSAAQMISVVDRMLEFFIPTAVHANNCAPGLDVGQHLLPSVFEVTFLNKSFQESASPSNVVFPEFLNCPKRGPLTWPVA